ncbi:uncharacterized protein LOC134082097 isoform X2 [Sardina pilchardus]|uniref:uncharacterized protein LOC134082097 isoform X2 n=1 Tax=Sardina pilchardus TaxID=27697 RepID=UPI002E11B565
METGCHDKRTPVKRPKPYCKYRDQWDSEFTFLRRSRFGNSHAFCMVCNSDLSISHGGRNDIRQHEKSAKHKRGLELEAQQHAQPTSAFVTANATETDQVTSEEVQMTEISELGQHMDTHRQACIDLEKATLCITQALEANELGQHSGVSHKQVCLDLEKATQCITQALQHEVGRNQELCMLIRRLEEKEAGTGRSLTQQMESNKQLKLKIDELHKHLGEKDHSLMQVKQTVVLLKRELRDLRQQRQSQQTNRTVQDGSEWLQSGETQIRQIRIPSSPLHSDQLTAEDPPVSSSAGQIPPPVSSDAQGGQIPPPVSSDVQSGLLSGIKEENPDHGYEEWSQYGRADPRTEQTTSSAADIKSEQIQTSLVSSDGQRLLEAPVSEDEDDDDDDDEEYGEYGHPVKRRKRKNSGPDQTMNPSAEIKAEQMFQVVEFYKDKPITVAVVVKSWIATTSEGLICYWPPSKASKKARRGVAPDNDRWQQRSVRIVPHTPTNDYTKALHWAKKAETQCNVESNSEVGKRRNVVPARYQEDSSDSSTTDNEDQPWPRAGHHISAPPSPSPPPSPPPPPQPGYQQHDSGLTPNGGHIFRGSNGVAFDMASQAGDVQQLTDTASQAGDVQHLTDMASQTGDVKELTDTASQAGDVQQLTDATDQAGDVQQLMAMMTSFQTKVLSKMEQILETKQELIRLVCAAAAAASSSSVVVPSRSLLMEPLSRPCATQQDLDALCARILTEDTFPKQLVSALCLDGSKRLGLTVRRMMCRLGTRELWSAFSLRGRKKKACFADLPLLQVLTMACTTCHPEVKIADVEKEVAEFLKHAPFKKGGTGKSGSSASFVVEDSAAPDHHHLLSASPGCPSPSHNMLLF